MDNIWAAALRAEMENSTDDVIPLMERQCQELAEASGKRIRGRFVKLRQSPIASGFIGALNSFSNRMSNLYTTADEDRLSQRDISSDYDERCYAFDVYSDDYTFRPFEISLGPVYPITLSVDEVIWRESRDQFVERLATGEHNATDSKVTLYDGNQLMVCFEVIVNSRKMRFILRKMMSSSMALGEQEQGLRDEPAESPLLRKNKPIVEAERPINSDVVVELPEDVTSNSVSVEAEKLKNYQGVNSHD